VASLGVLLLSAGAYALGWPRAVLAHVPARPTSVVDTVIEEIDRAMAWAKLDNDGHEVQPGDTCWQIAQDHDVPLEELLALNGLDDASCRQLRVGRVLQLP
jgi:hypothetical protein